MIYTLSNTAKIQNLTKNSMKKKNMQNILNSIKIIQVGYFKIRCSFGLKQVQKRFLLRHSNFAI